MVKNMEINQEKFVIDYVNDMRTLYTYLQKKDKEMETMKANHDGEINYVQNKLLTMNEEMTIMTFDYSNQLATMQANHKKEINSMKHFLMTIKERNDKVIKDIETSHMSSQ